MRTFGPPGSAHPGTAYRQQQRSGDYRRGRTGETGRPVRFGLGPAHCTFITGCPPIDRQNGSSFYQVLVSGRLQLLCLSKRPGRKISCQAPCVRNLRSAASSIPLRDETILRLKRDKETVLALMNDRRSDIEAWLKAHKNELENTKMLTELFDYYNSLLAAF